VAVSNADVAAAEAEADVPPENRRIVAFVTDEASSAALRASLVGLGRAAEVRRGSVPEASRYLSREPEPHLLLVDISGQPDPHVALDDLARVCPPNVKVIVVGDNTDIAFYRLVVHDLGATEYVHKPLTRDSIHRLVLPHVSGNGLPHPGTRGGHVVAVCGARGGVGATTIAVNTALEVSRVTGGHVALLDLHLQGGCAAAMLAGRPGPGLRMALEDPDGVDSLFLERAAIAVTPRLRLIAAEEGFDTEPAISEAGVPSLLEQLRQKFNFVIVDVPMPLPASIRAVLALARHVIIVLMPEVFSLRDTMAIRQLVASVASADRAVTVLNHMGVSGGLKPALIRKGLAAEPDVIIPELGKGMLEAANLGVPAVDHVRALRRHLAPLIREITGARTAEAGRPLLARVLRR
jgi:pilus assembly protein CpaE